MPNSDTVITIVHGLPSEYCSAAAELYYAAFRQKLHPIIRSETAAVALLAQALNPDFGITALYGDVFAGVAGVQYGGGHFVDITPALMKQHFGLLRGWLKILPLSLMARPQQEGQLLMDGIVVAPEMRGRGVGTALLQAVMDFARERGFRDVRLDVVDTNPRARQLYERRGFVATETHRYPYLRKIMGFGAVTTMIKAVARE